MFLNKNLSDISNKQTVQQHKIKNMYQASMKHCKIGTIEPYIMKYESMSTIYEWSGAPGLVSRTSSTKPGWWNSWKDGCSVVATLCTAIPENCYPAAFDLLECAQKLARKFYAFSFRLLGKTQKNPEGNFSDFDFAFSASWEPLSGYCYQIRLAGNNMQTHLERLLKCFFHL